MCDRLGIVEIKTMTTKLNRPTLTFSSTGHLSSAVVSKLEYELNKLNLLLTDIKVGENLSYAFSWTDSPQGWAFWSLVGLLNVGRVIVKPSKFGDLKKGTTFKWNYGEYITVIEADNPLHIRALEINCNVVTDIASDEEVTVISEK